MNKYLLYLMLGLLFVACKKDANQEKYQPKFIVEGSIEQDGYALVTITHNLPYYAKIDSAQVEEIIIKYAKVTVTDGTEEEVLTGSYDRGRFPYFFYKGSSLKGKAGKGYQLKIEYAGNTLTAETQIPERPRLDSIWFEPRKDNERQLCISFTDPVQEKNYYKIYTRLQSQKEFIRTLLSNQDDQYFNGQKIELKLNRGSFNNLTKIYEPYFLVGDQVQLKFSTIPKSGFDFWQGFQNEIINASNPLMGSTAALKSNINGNGAGIWCGYGSSIYTITAN
ncbi:DUF4249 family protein [Pedobacter endophyticus]|uniref:DUF4249 family protein n=1 Tax=Pedobacter endophyticus TaxID=2789740 RepID=A0A7S9Q0V1_9SPHI|nr:DUF4249 family protein [Pedobacter endophyticus]QPH41107.1 DUF4249 family protein [Pedobacter endophyticus]